MRVKLILWLLLFVLCLPSTGQIELTKRIALLDVIDKDNTFAKGVKMLINSKLSFAITNIPGYECLERIDISSIMNEQEFQRTGLVDDSHIKQLGEMTSADYILVTEIAKLDEQQMIITSKILDVESAQMKNAADVLTTTNVDEMEKNCMELAKKLFKWTPPIEELKKEIKDDDIFIIAEMSPSFPGGEYKLLDWLNKNLIYPISAIEKGIQGNVVVQFVVEKNGMVTNPTILKGVSPELDAEALRVISSMPIWIPGRQSGRPVRVKYVIPITFRLQ